MTTKKQIIDTLELYTWNKIRIDKIEEECRSLESRALSLQTSQGGGVQTHSSGNARYTKAVESLADTIRKRYAEIDRLNDTLSLAEQMIENCEDPKQRLILSMRYIEGQRAFDLSVALGITEKHVYRLQKAGIESIYNKLNKG